jgi:hypothetical protein
MEHAVTRMEAQRVATGQMAIAAPCMAFGE